MAPLASFVTLLLFLVLSNDVMGRMHHTSQSFSSTQAQVDIFKVAASKKKTSAGCATSEASSARSSLECSVNSKGPSVVSSYPVAWTSSRLSQTQVGPSKSTASPSSRSTVRSSSRSSYSSQSKETSAVSLRTATSKSSGSSLRTTGRASSPLSSTHKIASSTTKFASSVSTPGPTRHTNLSSQPIFKSSASSSSARSFGSSSSRVLSTHSATSSNVAISLPKSSSTTGTTPVATVLSRTSRVSSVHSIFLSSSSSPPSKLITTTTKPRGSNIPSSSYTTTIPSSSLSSISTSTVSFPILTNVSTKVVTNPTSCYQMPAPAASLLEVSDPDTVNTTLGTVLDVFLDPVTNDVIYLGLQLDDLEYLYDFSNLPSSLAIILPSGNALVVDNNGFHAFAANCSMEADILVSDLFGQLEADASVTTNLTIRDLNRLQKRFQTDFQVDMQISDQCGELVTSQIFSNNALALGTSSCILLDAPQTNPSIGVWAWGCQYPGAQSAEGQCEIAVTNDLTSFVKGVNALGNALTAAGLYLTYGPKAGFVEFNELVPVLQTGVEAGKSVLQPAKTLSDTVTNLGPAKIATNVCSRYASPPYNLVFTPESGLAIDVAQLGAPPLLVLQFSEAIQNSNEPPDCIPPVTCQPSTAQLEEAWDLPCNVVQNPGLNMDGLDVFGYPYLGDEWGSAGGYNAWNFGYGGTSGSGLPDGSNGCSSGQANDTCITIQTDNTYGDMAWIITTLNVSELHNGTYVMSAYINLLSMTGTAAPGSPSSACIAQFYLDDAYGTIQPAIAYIQATDGFQVISYGATLVFMPVGAVYVTPAEERLGLVMLPGSNPNFGIGVQCPPGIEGVFVIDNISMCDVDDLCASTV